LSSQKTSKPSEKMIQEKLFREILPKMYPDSVIVKNWLGWSYRGKDDKKEQTKFWREFDIALFQRETIPRTAQFVVLTGFEIKGFAPKSLRPPAFAEGLDQANVLLLQGANYSYLVHPEPEKSGDKHALKELCDNFSPHVGLIFIPHELEKLTYLTKYREARDNPSSEERKRKMLASLVTGGLRDEISELPLWCKKQQY
jgi:hypothetical protein